MTTETKFPPLKPSERCHPTCPGWFIGTANDERGDFIMRCDECGRFEWDDDAATLPEARRALAKVLVPNDKRRSARTLAVLREVALREHGLRMTLANMLANLENEPFNVRQVTGVAVSIEMATEALS